MKKDRFRELLLDFFSKYPPEKLIEIVEEFYEHRDKAIFYLRKEAIRQVFRRWLEEEGARKDFGDYVIKISRQEPKTLHIWDKNKEMVYIVYWLPVFLYLNGYSLREAFYETKHALSVYEYKDLNNLYLRVIENES